MTRVFLSTWGQNDNLGDSVLRRGLLQSFHESADLELHVFIGNNDDDYLTALGLRGDETLYRDRSEWWRIGARGLLRERTVLVQTAGELFIPEGQPLAGWRTLLGVLVARARGGGGMQVGAGARRPSQVVPPVERLARRVMPVVSWRDAETRAAFKIGSVTPDWAFVEGSLPATWNGPSASQRPLLTVTFRHDRRPLPEAKLATLRRIAAEHGLRIQVLTQVRRDEGRAREVADALGSSDTPILWTSESHAEWEAVVRDVYRRSAVVAGDRAHALIIGATEGAVPLATSGESIEKLVRIMAPAEFALPADDDGEAVQMYARTMLGRPESVGDRVTSARRQVLDVRAQISRNLQSRPSNSEEMS